MNGDLDLSVMHRNLYPAKRVESRVRERKQRDFTRADYCSRKSEAGNMLVKLTRKRALSQTKSQVV